MFCMAAVCILTLLRIKAEEPPSALLLAHAALLSARKQARRKAALLYLFAANRLEKCGIVGKFNYNTPLYIDCFLSQETFDDVFSAEGACSVQAEAREVPFTVVLGLRRVDGRRPRTF
jgi:hypothetical protein